MRSSSAFFKIFPPPSFLVMPYAGLDISDSSIRCLAYKGSGRSRRLAFLAETDLPPGLVDGGDIKDEKEFSSRLSKFVRENGLSYVRVSVPEEKAYLFRTEVQPGPVHNMAENIEFKLEENVPLSGADALFHFDLLPKNNGPLLAYVSVVPRTYIEHQISLIKSAGAIPMSFEIVPKAVARAITSEGTADAALVLHAMDRKTGVYITSGSCVCFTSTVVASADAPAELAKEVFRVHAYWASHGTGRPIKEVLIVGRDTAAVEAACRQAMADLSLPLRPALVWQNAFSLERYVPPVSRDDSLRYAVAAGLALDVSDA